MDGGWMVPANILHMTLRLDLAKSSSLVRKCRGKHKTSEMRLAAKRRSTSIFHWP
jgi:hypothetical protein